MSETENQPLEAGKIDITEALHVFAQCEASPKDRKAALTALIGSKILPKQADDPRVCAGRECLIASAVSESEPGFKLMGIAESIRLGQVVKRWLPDIAQRLAPAFQNKLPSMQLLADADDRLNLARACALQQPEWMPAYLARSIAEEETGEKARSEMITALLTRVPTLAMALQLLGNHFVQLRPATEIPGDTISRRLTRTLGALREAIIESDLEPGEGLGKSLYRLISGSLSAVGKPQDDQAKLDLSREVLLTVHDIVRTRISVVADPEMYSSVAYCRQMYSNRFWPDELKKPLERLITDVTEALVLLGRQGQCDQTLLAQLDVLCSHPQRARTVAKELAAQHPELPESVREWLEKGRMRVSRTASEAAIESAASSADESIGLALRVAREARQMRDNLRERLISDLEIYEPSLVSVTAELLDRIQVLAIQVEQAAGIRRLDLLGSVGQEVEMSAKYFDIVGSNPRQRMVVRQPAIVRKRPDGSLGDAVIKGLVE